MKKLKCVFIDMEEDRRRRQILEVGESLPLYSTFQEYHFDRDIMSRVKELFGWTTDLMKDTSFGTFEISIHIISLNFLHRHGIAQHFYSPHGPKYDDKYSYLHGMNLLTFEGYNRVHLIYSIKRILGIFQEKLITTQKRRFRTRREEEIKNSFFVPVDHPRIGILTPTRNLINLWVKQLNELTENIRISNDIRDLVPDITPDHFVDYSLSRNYQCTLEDYIEPLNSILEAV